MYICKKESYCYGCQKQYIRNNKFKDLKLSDLSNFGVDIRYPDDFYIPEKQETEEYIEIALEVKTIVEK